LKESKDGFDIRSYILDVSLSQVTTTEPAKLAHS